MFQNDRFVEIPLRLAAWHREALPCLSTSATRLENTFRTTFRTHFKMYTQAFKRQQCSRAKFPYFKISPSTSPIFVGSRPRAVSGVIKCARKPREV